MSGLSPVSGTAAVISDAALLGHDASAVRLDHAGTYLCCAAPIRRRRRMAGVMVDVGPAHIRVIMSVVKVRGRLSRSAALLRDFWRSGEGPGRSITQGAAQPPSNEHRRRSSSITDDKRHGAQGRARRRGHDHRSDRRVMPRHCRSMVGHSD